MLRKGVIIGPIAILLSYMLAGCIMRSQVRPLPTVSPTVGPDPVIVYDKPIRKSDNYYEVSYNTETKVHTLIPAEQYYNYLEEHAVG